MFPFQKCPFLVLFDIRIIIFRFFLFINVLFQCLSVQIVLFHFLLCIIVLFQICSFQDCPFSLFLSRIVLFRIWLSRPVLFRFFLFRSVLFQIFPFQNCPFSDFSFPNYLFQTCNLSSASFIRVFLFRIALHHFCFKRLHFTDVSYSDLSCFKSPFLFCSLRISHHQIARGSLSAWRLFMVYEDIFKYKYIHIYIYLYMSIYTFIEYGERPSYE